VIASKLAPTKSVGVGDREVSKSAATPVGASLLANRAKPILRNHIDIVIASKLAPTKSVGVGDREVF
jgi:hypothetical protein